MMSVLVAFNWVTIVLLAVAVMLFAQPSFIPRGWPKAMMILAAAGAAFAIPQLFIKPMMAVGFWLGLALALVTFIGARKLDLKSRD